jgi:oligoribonuclease
MTDVKMAWFDMETTGLDAYLDVPLELAVVLTDDLGNEIVSESVVIFEHNEDFYRGYTRGRENEYVREMHEKSGLWDDLDREGTPRSRSFAEDYFVALMESRGVQPGTLPMCGNSIGSLDRPFLIRHFPKLNEFLHYRNIDMSSDKELMRIHRPDLFEDSSTDHREQDRLECDTQGS